MKGAADCRCIMSFICLKDVRYSYSQERQQTINGISLDIEKGSFVAVIGHNGSGKSTLVKVISGVYRPDCGSIEINGKTYDHMTPMESTQNGIQIIYQDFSLFPNLKVFENIAYNMVACPGI